jgi:hypothetical protein
MRKETAKIAAAFKAGKPAKGARTHTDGQSVWLHGNMIAQRRDDGFIMLTMSDWNTPTTRERLNGIAQTLGLQVRFYQKKHAAMMRECVNGQWIDGPIDPRDMLGFKTEVA